MRKVVVGLVWVVAATTIWAWPSLGSAVAAELRVATFRCDVTPPLGYLTRIGLRARAAVMVTMLPPVFCANIRLMASWVT